MGISRSGGIGVRYGAGAPSAEQIPQGLVIPWHDTSTGVRDFYWNDAGTVRKWPYTSAAAPGTGTSYAWNDGYVFADDYEQGWALDFATAGSTVTRQAAANSATQDQITILSHSLKWSSIPASGQLRLFKPGGQDIDPYDAIVLGIRDDSGSAQPFYFALQDSSGVRINNFATLTPTGAPISGRAGLAVRYGGDGSGAFKQQIVKLGGNDTTLTGSPYNGAWGGYGLGMPATGRTRAYYILIEHAAGTARSGNLYLDEIRFVRKVARNVPTGFRSGSEIENGLPLNRQLNYVAPITLTRDALPAGVTWAPDFLPYWQKVVDGLFYNGAPVAGATEEILEYANSYWGFSPGTIAAYFYKGTRNPSNTGGPPTSGIQGSAVATNFRDLTKAQANHETNWRQGVPSDWNNQTLNGLAYQSWASFGIGQQKWFDWGPVRVPFLSTVFSALYKAAIVRAIYDGAIPEYHNMSPSPTGNIRLALEAYFNFSTAAGDQANYPSMILGNLANTIAGYINQRLWEDKATPWPWTNTNTV